MCCSAPSNNLSAGPCASTLVLAPYTTLPNRGQSHPLPVTVCSAKHTLLLYALPSTPLYCMLCQAPLALGQAPLLWANNHKLVRLPRFRLQREPTILTGSACMRPAIQQRTASTHFGCGQLGAHPILVDFEAPLQADKLGLPFLGLQLQLPACAQSIAIVYSDKLQGLAQT